MEELDKILMKVGVVAEKEVLEEDLQLMVAAAVAEVTLAAAAVVIAVVQAQVAVAGAVPIIMALARIIPQETILGMEK